MDALQAKADYAALLAAPPAGTRSLPLRKRKWQGKVNKAQDAVKKAQQRVEGLQANVADGAPARHGWAIDWSADQSYAQEPTAALAVQTQAAPRRHH